MRACVRVRVCACVRVRVCACVRARACMRVRMCAHVCVRASAALPRELPVWERTEGGQDGQLWGPRSLSSVTRAQTHHMPARDPLEVLQESLNRSHLEFSFLAQLWVQRVRIHSHLQFSDPGGSRDGLGTLTDQPIGRCITSEPMHTLRELVLRVPDHQACAYISQYQNKTWYETAETGPGR